MLLGCWVAGLGVYFVFHHPAFGQAYFLRSTLVPIALLATLGWVRAGGPMTRRGAVVTGLWLAAGAGWAWLVTVLVPAESPVGQGGSERAVLFDSFGVPILVASVGVLVAAVVYHVLSGARSRPGRTLHATISLVLGMTLLAPVAGLARVAGAPRHPGPDHPGRRHLGGRAGCGTTATPMTSSRRMPTRSFARGPKGNHRHFWISAYTERRVLVEGWAYIPPESVGLPSNSETNSSNGPPTFWKPERLRLNDEVFEAPTAQNVAELHDRYGVDWLFAERQRKPDIARLDKLARAPLLERRTSSSTGSLTGTSRSAA